MGLVIEDTVEVRVSVEVIFGGDAGTVFSLAAYSFFLCKSDK